MSDTPDPATDRGPNLFGFSGRPAMVGRCPSATPARAVSTRDRADRRDRDQRAVPVEDAGRASRRAGGRAPIAHYAVGDAMAEAYAMVHLHGGAGVLALLRIKRPEALKEHAPPRLGRLLGLDRAPEVKTLRCKLAPGCASATPSSPRNRTLCPRGCRLRRGDPVKPLRFHSVVK